MSSINSEYKVLTGVIRNYIDYDICLYSCVFMKIETLYVDVRLWNQALNRHLKDAHINTIIKNGVAYILDKLESIYGMSYAEGFYYLEEYLKKEKYLKYWDLVEFQVSSPNNKIKNYIH